MLTVYGFCKPLIVVSFYRVPIWSSQLDFFLYRVCISVSVSKQLFVFSMRRHREVPFNANCNGGSCVGIIYGTGLRPVILKTGCFKQEIMEKVVFLLYDIAANKTEVSNPRNSLSWLSCLVLYMK